LISNSVKDSFGRVASKYDENADIQKHSLSALINFFFSKIKINDDEEFNGLEIGCGTGEFSKHLINRINFQSLSLLDISKNMLEIAQKKNGKEFVNLVESDFDDFKDYSKFNIIFSNMSIHWSKDFKKLVLKILNSVKKNGIIVLSYVNSSSFKYFNNLNTFNHNLLNTFPKHKDFLNLIDRKRFKYFQKEITIKKLYDRPLDFFIDLKSYGANFKLNSNEVGKLFMLRKIKKQIDINFNISCYSLRKIDL